MSHSRDYEDTGPTTAYYQGYKAGVEDTKKRIIKLLEQERLKHIPWCGKNACQICEQTMGIEKAIELIQTIREAQDD